MRHALLRESEKGGTFGASPRHQRGFLAPQAGMLSLSSRRAASDSCGCIRRAEAGARNHTSGADEEGKDRQDRNEDQLFAGHDDDAPLQCRRFAMQPEDAPHTRARTDLRGPLTDADALTRHAVADEARSLEERDVLFDALLKARGALLSDQRVMFKHLLALRGPCGVAFCAF